MRHNRETPQPALSPWRHAPYDVDPLTWLAGNRLPIAFALLVPLATVPTVFSASGEPHNILSQLAAIALMALACVVVHWQARPTRAPFRAHHVSTPLALASIATALSAANPPGNQTVSALVGIETWWAPLGFAFVLGALVPYMTVTTTLITGATASAATATSALLAYRDNSWPTVSTIAIALVPIVIATAGGTAFQWQVVTRISRWTQRATPAIVSGHLLQERARLAVVRSELAAISGRVSSILTDIADRANITDDDRERAAALADEIRTELVHRSNETWLNTVARGRPVTVIDPDHLADTMSPRQRSTVHALILTVLDSPEVEYPHVLIEIRRETQHSTAIAITIDAGLAEGRRIMLLAPHYLTLRTALDDLHWKGGDTIKMRFRVEPGSG